MGQAIISRIGNVDYSGPIIEFKEIRQTHMTIESDTVFKDDVSIDSFILTVNSQPINISRIIVNELSVKIYYPMITGSANINIKILGNAFKYTKPNCKENILRNMYTYAEKITDITIEPLSVARAELAATHIGNYAIFAGGYGYEDGDHDYVNTVDTYDINLTRYAPTVMLSVGRRSPASTHVGNYALFAGGHSSGAYVNTVDVYNSNLTKVTSSIEPLSVARESLAATHVGNYALFAGGYNDSSSSYERYKNTVDVYDINLTRSAPEEMLSVARMDLVATHVGNYALFAGGGYYNNNNSYVRATTVDVYDINLTWSAPEEMLSGGRYNLAATHVGDYALFAGGGGASINDIVDAYDSNLRRSAPTEMISNGQSYTAATHVGNCCIFARGYYNIDSPHSIDVYDSNLRKSTSPEALTYDVVNLAATHVGNYALFAGGWIDRNSSLIKDTVDVYTV